MKIKPGIYILLAAKMLFGGLALVSCDKEPFTKDPSAKLLFSSDTLLFDTVFTSIGTATRHFKVYNPFDKSLEIKSISLAGATESPYRINVDGIPGHRFDDIILHGGDSLYVFVEATIDPVEGNLPMVVKDSVVFITNGNIQNVKLVAWGQDVNIIRGEKFTSGILESGKPYLVYDFMMVDSGQVLSVEPGVRIHFQPGSGLFVAGTILVFGTPEEPVIFQGARTESGYRNIPGQWEGVWLMPGSTGSRIVHTSVRNGVNGIIADSLASPGDTTLYLANSRIENMTYAGLYAREAVVYSYNTVIANCGHHTIVLSGAGDYTFYHSTFANYWNFSSRRTSSVIIQNHTETGSSGQAPIRVLFGNSIIHGSLNQEIRFLPQRDERFDVLFSHSLLGIDDSFASANSDIFLNCIYGFSPGFTSPSSFNFRPESGSVLIDAGDPEIGALHPLDLDGNLRVSDSAPDIGAYEWYKEEEEEE